VHFEMTYTVSGGALNSTNSLTHSLTVYAVFMYVNSVLVW